MQRGLGVSPKTALHQDNVLNLSLKIIIYSLFSFSYAEVKSHV
ncbi:MULTISPECIES: hypothetical protein [unclassified Moorena]|nr:MULTISPECIES: hypothetical protein [unclassified Moorena]